MAHAPGWIELYGLLEEGREPSPALVEQCRDARNGIGETMLHWYAIEGAPDVLQKLVELGFDVDVQDEGGNRPIVSAAMIGRWDNVCVLKRAGARTRGVTHCGTTYRGLVTAAGDELPGELRGDAYDLDDLLDPNGPEDTDVMLLRVTREGLPPTAPGAPLTQTNWDRWLAAQPELETSQLRFDDGGGDSDAAYVEALCPDLELRRCVHRIALHFGARVIWDFVCPE